MKPFIIMVDVRDARELPKLESRLLKYSELISKTYLYGKDSWGRRTVKKACYTVLVQKVREFKIMLSQLQNNGKISISF